MIQNEITLNSRVAGTKLVKIGEDDSLMYKLVTPHIMYRMGIIEGNNEEYSFIDPSGGPFITPGYKVGEYKVKRILKEGIIELEL